jgi:hypothetical protein
MAIEDVQGIVDSIHKAYARRLESQRLAQEQANQEGMRDEAKQRIDIERQRFKDEAEHRRADDEMRRAASKTAHLEFIQKMSAAAERGEPVPNAIISPNALDPTKQIFTIPNDNPHLPPDVVDTRTPSEYSKQMLQEARTKDQPRHENVMEEQAAQKKADLEKDQQDRAAQMARLTQQLASEERRTNVTAAATRFAATQRHEDKESNLAPEEIGNAVTDIHDGNLTLPEAISKYKGSDWKVIRAAADAAGVKFYTKDQKALLGDAVASTKVLSKIDELDDVVRKNPNLVKVPFTDSNITASRLMDQIVEDGISSLKLVGQGSKLSDRRVEAWKKAFGGSYFLNPQLQNKLAREGYKELIVPTIKSKLRGLNPDQINRDLNNLGLLDDKNRVPDDSVAAPDDDKAKKLNQRFGAPGQFFNQQPAPGAPQ